MSLVKVFTAPNCVYCQLVKNYLRSLEISFEEVDLTRDEAQLRWLEEHIGQRGIPVTLFNEQQFVIGWQKEMIDGHLRDLKLIK